MMLNGHPNIFGDLKGFLSQQILNHQAKMLVLVASVVHWLVGCLDNWSLYCCVYILVAWFRPTMNWKSRTPHTHTYKQCAALSTCNLVGCSTGSNKQEKYKHVTRSKRLEIIIMNADCQVMTDNDQCLNRDIRCRSCFVLCQTTCFLRKKPLFQCPYITSKMTPSCSSMYPSTRQVKQSGKRFAMFNVSWYNVDYR